MLLLDTDLISLVQDKSGRASEKLNKRLEEAAESHVIAVSIVSLEEQMRGWLAYLAAARTIDRQIVGYRRLHEALDAYSSRILVDFDERAAAQYQQLVRGRIRIGTMDLRIAAIALANGATLLSKNLVHFRKVPGLRVEDWSV